MATNFPGSIDIFANPTVTKVDGIDLVGAAHVNDIQDAVLAIQNLVITPGAIFAWGATNWPDDKSLKEVILILDGLAATVTSDLADHIAYVLVTDPVQHHANVIEVTPGGNLASDRVQTALEEHQTDVDNIMSGGNVEGITLDNRYVGKTGDHTMAGSLVIETDLDVEGDTTLGLGIANTTLVNGVLTVTNGQFLTGDLDITTGNIILDDTQWIGIDQYGSLTFSSDETWLKSKKDLVLQIDSDDLVDGGPFDGYLRIKNGSSADVMTVDEAGDTWVLGVLAAASMSGAEFAAGNTSLVDGVLSTTDTGLQIDLDSDNDGIGEELIITKNNNTADPLLKLEDDSTLTTGIHVLKTGIQETGYFGLKFNPTVGGTEFAGTGVNFKSVMTNGPSSITLTVTGSLNYQNLSVVDSGIYGFFFEFAGIAPGASMARGTYTTVGN